MELAPDDLRTAARRWDALASDLAEAAGTMRGAPTAGLGRAAGEAVLLLAAAEGALLELRDGTERLVDGLLVSARLATDVDDRVAAALARIRPGLGQ